MKIENDEDGERESACFLSTLHQQKIITGYYTVVYMLVIIYCFAYRLDNSYHHIINYKLNVWMHKLCVFNKLHSALPILWVNISHANKVNEMSNIELRDVVCIH